MVSSKFLNANTNTSLGTADDEVPSQNAVKVYVDGKVSDPDNVSINKNSSNKLQTIGVIDQNDTTTGIKTWTGTRLEYDSILTKDDDTIYNVIDEDSVSNVTPVVNNSNTIYTLEELSRIVDGLAETDTNKLDINAMNSNANTPVGLNANGTVTIVETYISGSSWYRVYSDGWCEQGGIITSPASTGNNDIIFIKAFVDTNYYFNRINESTVNSTATNFACEGYTNKSTTGISVFAITSYLSAIIWEAKGYIS